MEHAFEVYEKVMDGCLHEVVDIDKMQYEIMPGGEILEAVFILRRLSENSEPEIQSCFLYLLNWKKLLIGCQEKLFILL